MEKIRLENTGPIDFIEIEFENAQGRAPKPVVLVGKNGSGKSIVISNVVSAMVHAHGTIFDDSDVENGFVYKMRSPQYIKSGENYSLSSLKFSNEFEVTEITLNRSKKCFEDDLKYTPIFPMWNKINDIDNSYFTSNYQSRIPETRAEFNGPNIFFPPNRFEEPAWQNENHLKNKVEYTKNNNLQNQSNRPVIEYSPMEENQKWLLDLIYDSYAIETKNIVVMQSGKANQEFLQQDGPASQLRLLVDNFIIKLLGGVAPIRWSVGRRANRSISINDANETLLTNNLFSLSTGQAVLLDIFLSILRHVDIANANINSVQDIQGLVVIDEVDLHLHADLQYQMLPELIKSFPKIQFLLSSHSPLFLLGMQNVFGEDGFQIIDLPSGKVISSERFSEFDKAYNYLTNTRKFEQDINKKIDETSKPILIVEGTTDIDYIIKAADHLDQKELLNNFDILDGDGSAGLNKIWKNYSHDKWKSINQTIILLYDCDESNKNNEIGKAFQRTLPLQDSILTAGIENLFSTETIQRAQEYKIEFIDYMSASSRRNRGVEANIEEAWKVNPDEKRNLCNWLCKDGTKEEFQNFSIVFDILRDCLK